MTRHMSTCYGLCLGREKNLPCHIGMADVPRGHDPKRHETREGQAVLAWHGPSPTSIPVPTLLWLPLLRHGSSATLLHDPCLPPSLSAAHLRDNVRTFFLCSMAICSGHLCSIYPSAPPTSTPRPPPLPVASANASPLWWIAVSVSYVNTYMLQLLGLRCRMQCNLFRL